MSSIIVYGNSTHIDKRRIIDRGTIPQPSNFYGESKLQAEIGIKLLESDTFKVVIIRPPMIYGKGSKGNYPRLASYARKLPFFPDIDNKRSVLHIDNLCEFTRLMIKNQENGLFFPQNKEYIKTSSMVKTIAEVHGRKVLLTNKFNFVLKLMIPRIGVLDKIFGNLIYEHSVSAYKMPYCVRNFHETIVATELESEDS